MKGFTLVEIIVAIGISSVILVALALLMGTAIPLYRSTFLQASAIETARLQLQRLSHTIRSAKPADTGAFPIVEATDFRLVFDADIDDDVSVERVRYEKIGTDLVRGVTQPTGVPITYNVGQEAVTTVARFIQNGANPVFTYYGSSYPGDTTPVPSGSLAAITYISFSLLIDADTVNDPPAITVQSQVQLRNLKMNL